MIASTNPPFPPLGRTPASRACPTQHAAAWPLPTVGTLRAGWMATPSSGSHPTAGGDGHAPVAVSDQLSEAETTSLHLKDSTRLVADVCRHGAAPLCDRGSHEPGSAETFLPGEEGRSTSSTTQPEPVVRPARALVLSEGLGRF